MEQLQPKLKNELSVIKTPNLLLNTFFRTSLIVALVNHTTHQLMQRIVLRTFFLPILLVPLFLWAQVDNPEDGEAFKQESVQKIAVTLAQTDLDWMLKPANLGSDLYHPASFVYTNSNGVEETYTGCGLRLRGNTSRGAGKKSFKIHTEKFGGTEQLYDLKRINLKGGHNDPSEIRERLTFMLMRQLGGAAARANHVELYINGEYKGLYTHVEQIGKEFLRQRFDDDAGNLYKCSWGASLATNNDVYDEDVFELKTNEDVNDRSDLEELIDVLNNTPDERFKSEIEQVLNVESVLRYFAVEVLTGHWDGYSFNKNNFYLYHNSKTDQFELIIYDTDNTYGIDWLGYDWGKRNIYTWYNSSASRPLFSRLLDVPTYRQQYTNFIHQMLEGPYKTENVFPIIDDWKSTIRPFVASDTYYPLDYGFELDAFDDSFDEKLGQHVKYGLKPFIERRTETAYEQVDESTLSAPVQEETAHWSFGYLRGESGIWFTSDRFQKEVSIHILTMDGRIVSAIDLPGMTANQREEITLPAGIYVLAVEAEGTLFRTVVAPIASN